MIKQLRVTAPFLVGAALALVVLTGCTQSAEPPAPTPPAENGEEAPRGMTLEIVEQWAESRHAQVVTRAATEEGCKNCHDGLTFTTTGGGFQPRVAEPAPGASAQPDANDPGTDEGGEESARDFTVGVDCRVCHMGVGATVADRGTVDQIPSIPTAEGGLGAVCMSCHNGWHAAGKSAEGEPTGPHTSVQTDMLYGVNTVDPGVDSATAGAAQQSPHLKVENTCVGCHVTGSDTDGPNHTFRVADFEGCEGEDCHDQDMTDGGTAKEDYDGDGTIEKVVVEIEGLTEALKAAIEAKAGAFESARGQVALTSGAAIDDATYAAAYNYFFVVKDGSRGVHNAAFTVDILRRSIEAVGGTATP